MILGILYVIYALISHFFLHLGARLLLMFDIQEDFKWNPRNFECQRFMIAVKIIASNVLKCIKLNNYV